MSLNARSDDSCDDRAGVSSETDEHRRRGAARTGCPKVASGRAGQMSADDMPNRPESRLLYQSGLIRPHVCEGGYGGSRQSSASRSSV